MHLHLATGIIYLKIFLNYKVFKNDFTSFAERLIIYFAGVAELADALDLGSSVFDVGVQVSPSAPFISPTHEIMVILKFRTA